MRKILIAVATLSIAAVAASPAVAKSKRVSLSPQARAAYAQYRPNDPDVVVFGNKVIGRDPDINIRAALLRDPVPNEY